MSKIPEVRNGCDSIVTLTLKLYHDGDTTIQATVCYNDQPYYFGTEYLPYQEPGGPYFYSRTTTDANGCEDTISLELTVLPYNRIYLPQDTVCYGERYEKHGFNSVMYYSHTLWYYGTNSFGCDSIVTVYVEVMSTTTRLIKDTICDQDFYYENGFHLENLEVGIHKDTLYKQSVFGCDSTIYLKLLVSKTDTTYFYDTICHWEPYTLNGFWVNEHPQYPGQPNVFETVVGDNYFYSEPVMSLSGCDSVACLCLFADTAYISAEIYYNCGDIVPAAPPEYPIVNTAVNGCDSIFFWALPIHDSYNFFITDTVCAGEYYTGKGLDTTFYEAGHQPLITIENTTVNGCDSIAEYDIYVMPKYDTLFRDTVCQYEYYDNKYDFDIAYWATYYTGTYSCQKSLQTIYGCDSIVRLELFVARKYNNYNYAYHESCDSVVINEFGFDTTFREVGSYIINPIYETIYGCDSSTYIKANVYGSKTHYINELGCIGGQYRENGFNILLNEVGTIHDTLYLSYEAGSLLCDSTVYLELEVMHPWDVFVRDTACYGSGYYNHGYSFGSITFNGTIQLDSIYESIAGCDSTVMLELFIAPSFDTTFYDSICYKDGYYQHGFDIDPDSLHVGLNLDTLFLTTSTIYTCDSIVYLELYVKPSYDTTFYDTICRNEQPYQEHGFDLDSLSPGLHHVTLQYKTVLNCDSLIHLDLLVTPTYDTTLFDSICHKDYYNNYGFSFDTDSLYPGLNDIWRIDTTIYGCDSLISLKLTIKPVYDTTFYDTICRNNQPYQLHGFDLDSLTVGTHYYTRFLQTTLGCDSTVHLDLYVAPIYDTLFTDTICRNEQPYQEHGFNLDNLTVGTHIDTLFLQTTLGCDSLVRLELYVAPTYDTTLFDSICHKDYYNNYGFSFDTDSLYPGLNDIWRIDTTIYGCDSLISLKLTIKPVYDTTFYDTICRNNQPYQLHGFDLDSLTVGTHYYTRFLQTTLGCDSTVHLDLYVAPVYDTLFTDTICRNEQPYQEHGFNLDNLTVGTHIDTLFLQTTLGCDSLVRLELYVAPTYDTTLFDSICHKDYYNNYGFSFDTDSLYPGLNDIWRIDTTIYGCDSLISLKLTIKPVYDTTFFDTICFGYGYHLHGFDLDSLSFTVGWNYDTINPGTVLGCDSLVYLELYVAPIYDTLFTDTICRNEQPYQEHGFNLDNLTVGTHIDTLFLQTTLGCDSLVRLELYVAPIYDTMFQDTACINEGYHLHGFEIDSLELGWNYDTMFLASAFGCDSTVMLKLFVAPVFDTTFHDTICYNEQPYQLHGFDLDGLPVGMNYDNINPGTILGCDSLVYLELYVAPVYDINIYDSICFGENYNHYNFDTVAPAPGLCLMQQELVTGIGCDSIVTLELFVGEVYDITIHDTICYGNDYDKYNFHLVNPPVGMNSETQSLSTMYSCDSIMNLNLYVAPVYSFNVVDSICEGEDYNNYGLFIPQPAPGVYNVVSALETELGCDSIFNVNFKVIYSFATPDTIYGPHHVFFSTDMLPGKYRYWVDTITGCRDYHWELDNDYWLISTDKNNCIVTVTTPDVATLTMWAGNSCGSVSKSIEIAASYFGVDENGDINVNVYPNPSNGYVNVEGNDIEAVNVLSVTGVVVRKLKFDDEDIVSIDINDLPNAIYVLEIVTRDGKCMRRVTKTQY